MTIKQVGCDPKFTILSKHSFGGHDLTFTQLCDQADSRADRIAVLCDASFDVSVSRQRQKKLCTRPHLSLKLLQKRNNTVGRPPIVAPMQTQQEKNLHTISLKTC